MRIDRDKAKNGICGVIEALKHMWRWDGSKLKVVPSAETFD